MSNGAAKHEAQVQRERLGDRYQLQNPLGQGGMASVHSALDRSSGRVVALKQLTVAQERTQYGTIANMFEREFHTLAQLRHPHVIEVYDYGLLADGRPFYTMELLEGGDLRDCSPLPWQETCRLLFDVCSSLALIHSRRLLHRDISPRNIHRTGDGRAKLIDFGAMAPMSAGGSDVVGTPAFVAPETLHRLAIDARTDLYSLGVTFYYVLTGKLPYPARTFSEVLTAWGDNLRAAPSSFVPEIPAALDDLVLALIALDPALRPKSAFEVMQRMAAIAGLPLHESEAVARAYLSTPALVGREALLSQFRERLLAARMGRSRALLIEGAAGLGRSRALDACALEAKTLGFAALRATAVSSRARFAVARNLTLHLLEALPSGAAQRAAPELFEAPNAQNDNAVSESDQRLQLRDFAQLDAELVQKAILRCWIAASREQALLFAIDDVQRIDTDSAAVLASLIDTGRRGRTCIVLTANTDDSSNDALHALARRCGVLRLEPLTDAQTLELFGSVFGDVANLGMLARNVGSIAGGNPRQCIELAQYLVDRGVVRYASGSWSIPERLPSTALPSSVAATKRAQLDALSPNARFLAECHALAFFEDLSDRDYRGLLPDSERQDVERAWSELVSARVVVSDGRVRRVADGSWTSALTDAIAPAALTARHRALARMYEASTAPTAFVYHAFAAGLDEEAHAALARIYEEFFKSGASSPALFDLDVGKMMECFPRALESAERLGFGPRAMNELWHQWYMGTTTMQNAVVPACAARWLAQLEHDSGLDLYRKDSDSSDKGQRLMRALSGAQQRYQDTPEAHRVYSVEEAIRNLGHYVVVGIALGARAHEYEFLLSLPPLLEPFIDLSPLLHAVFNNALATCAVSEGATESARARWIAVWNQLQSLNDHTQSYVVAMSNAIAFAIGMTEAQLGLPSASQWADRLDADPYQRVSALQLRRIVRLQLGDMVGAEQLRRQAEVVSLQSRAPQMFKSLVAIELTACSKAGDLGGLQEALERMRAIAAQYPNWKSNLLLGEACFQLARGDYQGAKQRCEQCIALTPLDTQGRSKNSVTWLAASVVLADALLGLGQDEQARVVASRALDAYIAKNIGSGTGEIERVLALAEARLGDVDRALGRLTACIEEQTRRGSTGVQLGMLYEACAQIAIAQRDSAAFEQYAELVSREYRSGSGSGLSARYERLINGATRQGLRSPLNSQLPANRNSSSDWAGAVMRTMVQTQHGDERALAALQIICQSRNVGSGQLFLTGPLGLVLAAAQGQAPFVPIDEVRSFLERLEAQSKSMDDMDTDAALQDPTSTTIFVAGGSYVLLPLAFAQHDAQRIVGAAAVTHSELQVDRVRENQLLNLIAEHLLESTSIIATSQI